MVSRQPRTPSKLRQDEPDDTVQPTAPEGAKAVELEVEGNIVPTTEAPSTSIIAPQKAKELTPEEYEQQLEEEDLRRVVEQYATKSKRDSTRQVNRLRTERRILRGQSGELYTRSWVSDELTVDILGHGDENATVSGAKPSMRIANGSKKSQLREEELMVAIWTLQRTLTDLRFSIGRVSQAVQHMIRLREIVNPTTFREGSWGIDEALEYLAIRCDPTELSYEDQSATTDRSDESESQPNSKPSTGSVQDQFSNPQKNASHRTQSLTPAKPNITKPPLKEVEAIYEPVSDVDLDADPKQLTATYLRTKARLYRLDPSISSLPMGSKNKRGKPNGTQVQPSNSTELTKLKAKLTKIEGDVLFDKYEADQQWMPMQIDIERDLANTRKLERYIGNGVNGDLKDVLRNGNLSNAIGTATGFATHDSDDDSDEENGLKLDDLFEALPMEEVDPESGKVTKFTKDKDGTTILIRDFGNWTGLSPRRALEDMCRQKDTKAKLILHPLFTSAFSNRHKLQIKWPRAPEPLVKSTLKHFEVSVSGNSMFFEMVTASAVSKIQSETMVACAALYLLSLASAKDEKLYLRLPSPWRALWSEFAEERRQELEQDDMKSLNVIKTMVRAKVEQESEEPDDEFTDEEILLPASLAKRRAGTGSQSGTPNNGLKSGVVSEGLQNLWTAKSSTPGYHKMLQSRMKLPMWNYRIDLLDALERDQIIIVCGETGCGKSTQVPSYILEHELSNGRECRIYCTEPRRISALSLAKRVSEELGEQRRDLGTSRSLVGYAIRLESNISSETRLTFATTGIVMRMLESSNSLPDVTHLLLDEVHERTIDSDFLLIVLRKLMRQRPDLKVVLMSATVDAERFQAYLGGAPILTVPGRTFPVRTKFLEDAIETSGYTLNDRQSTRNEDDDDDDYEYDAAAGSKKPPAEELAHLSGRTRRTIHQMNEYRVDFDLVFQLIKSIAYGGDYNRYSKAILVFCPGIAEIRRLNDMFQGHPLFPAREWVIFPMHSSISSEDQEAAFDTFPAPIRKIVLATNIAETGITIPDVTCVIDLGKHKEMRFDERRQLSRLVEAFISRANAKQRRGRAGRVQEGLCFHLFTKYRHDNLLAEHQTPEMLRLSLQELVLRVKTCGLGGIEETLLQALDPPSSKNIRRAIDSLVDVKALTAAEALTPLGDRLARLPLDVHLGKLILLGCIFQCIDVCVTIAAILSSKSPFPTSVNNRAQADAGKLAFKRGDSDLLTVYNAYCAWRNVCEAAIYPGEDTGYCRRMGLSPITLAGIEDLKQQLYSSVVDAGFLTLSAEERSQLANSRYQYGSKRRFFRPPKMADVNSPNDLLATSVIGWSFYPKLLTRDTSNAKSWRNVANSQTVSLHSSSVNKGLSSTLPSSVHYLSYYHIMASTGQFFNAHETSPLEDFSVALLCGEAEFKLYSGVIVIDGSRARFKVDSWKTLMALKVLRAKVRAVLEVRFRQPGKALGSKDRYWMEMWTGMFDKVWQVRLERMKEKR